MSITPHQSRTVQPNRTASYPVVVIAGPTASGKTALALGLARALGNVEIVNFDSMQVYKDFDVGSAKPSAEELAAVPHHLVGEVSPEEWFTAGEYARRGRQRVRDIHQRGALPLLVGGTGFYLRALLEGLSELPEKDEALRQRLRTRVVERGPEWLHRLLRQLDAESAARIAVRDTPKVIRALEVRLRAGRSLREVWGERAPTAFTEARPIRLGLDPARAALYERINHRAEAMFAGASVSGPIQEETRALLERYPAHLRMFEAHGYKQACDIILRGASPAAALAEAQQEQRHYAKRQMTWFRRELGMHWLRGFGDEPAIQAEALVHVREALEAG